MKPKALGLALLGLAVLPLVGAPADAHGKRGGGDGWFDAMDANGDGKVTGAEIEAHRQARFAAADSNGDGTLSAEELAKASEQAGKDRRSRGLARMIERLDTNGDGSLSAQELAASDRMGSAMERLDANGDGAIEREELAERGRGFGRHREQDGQSRETR